MTESAASAVTDNLVGMTLICGAGVFVAWREGRPPRPQVHPRGEDPWTPDAENADKGA